MFLVAVTQCVRPLTFAKAETAFVVSFVLCRSAPQLCPAVFECVSAVCVYSTEQPLLAGAGCAG